MITRFPGVIVLNPPTPPSPLRASLVRPHRGLSLRTALVRVQQHAGVDARAAGLALARAGISVDLMRRPLAACSREVRRRVELAVALASGTTVVVIEGWLHGVEDRTARNLADTLRQLAAIDTAVYVIGHGLERFFPRLLGSTTTDRSVLVW